MKAFWMFLAAVTSFSYFSNPIRASELDNKSTSSTLQNQYGVETLSNPTASSPPTSIGGGPDMFLPTEPVPQARSEWLHTTPTEFFYVYSDTRGQANHFFPTGWMGDWNDIKMNQRCLIAPYSGKTCLEFVYTAKVTRGARWAGVYWQNPANNWGGIDGRYDLRGAKRLTFWARGKSGGERIETVKMGGIGGNFPDSDEVVNPAIVLTRDWRKYTIDLSKADLSAISGGFCWMSNADMNPNGITFYLDDIRYEFEKFNA
jgi:hypothetical protein